MINKGIRLLRVEISGFRGYDRKVVYNFPRIDSVFLLSGSNGYGKTSFFDAIEWCFTGEVQRLVDNLEIKRDKKNPTEQTIINNIQNRKKNIFASVSIKFILEEKVYEIKRVSEKYAKDYSKENTKIYLVSNNSEVLKDEEWINSIFYEGNLKTYKFTEKFANYHLCSHEKNLKILQKNREGIHSMLSILFGENKLDLYRKNIKEIVEKVKEKTKFKNEQYDEVQNLFSEILEGQHESVGILEYVKKYNENLLIGESVIDPKMLLEDNLVKRYERLQSVNYLLENQQEYVNYKEYLSYYKVKSEYDFFVSNIESVYIDLKNLLIEKNVSFDELEQKEKDLQILQKKMINLGKTLQEDGSIQDNDIDSFQHLLTEYKYEFQIVQLKDLLELVLKDNERKEIKNKITFMSNEKKHFERENLNFINMISYAAKHLQDSHDFDKCPLCMQVITSKKLKDIITEQKNRFSTWDREIARLENDYRMLLEKSIENKKDLQKEIECVLTFIKIEIKNVLIKIQAKPKIAQLEKDCKSLNLVLSDLNDHSIRMYRELIFKNVEDSLNKVDTSKILLPLKDISDYISLYEKELNTYGKFVNNVKSSKVQDNLSYLKQIINNNKYLVAKNKLEILKKELEILEKKQKNIIKIKTMVNKVANELEQMYKEELEDPINYVYKKINRHSNFSRINLSLPKNGGNKKLDTTVGEQGEYVNLSNILSSGQITTVALSFFLGIAFRKKFSKFNIYFFDDPIQHLDDLNVLSFVDLLRVHLKEHDFANQIFISTCNEDVDNLIVSKMGHFDIGVTKFLFRNYNEFEVVNC
ncbi:MULTISPECIES: AAA family ATPase [Bacillus]|uniref:AAA family ATPase n=1 Tax=Bacillus TaxID=1386 RepID=UPI0010A48FC7|nr:MULTISPECIES: AAA family ATPase [Bacillus]MDA4081889.1 AAA family ATPase [Bacillus cereus]QCC39255.1 hypothetical protein C3Y97_05025 [Bacillus sp. DU-106]